MRPYRLSKSRIIAGLQCPKRLFLSVHKPDILESSDTGAHAFNIGYEVHDAFRSLCADAVLVGHDDDLSAALSETHDILSQRTARPILEATLCHGGVLVRIDCLARESQGYVLTEVKSSTSVKDYHLKDSAVQAFVATGVGLPLARTVLAHIDSSFVYPGGGKYEGLFQLEDVTGQVAELMRQVPSWIDRFQTMLRGAEPAVQPGRHCFDPFECPYYSHCVPEVGPEFPVEILPWTSAIETQLIAEGYTDLRQVPGDRLTDHKLQRVWRATVEGRPYTDPALGIVLSEMSWPRAYLDFETIQFPVPRWAGTRPYQQLPFQFSCHVEHSNDRLDHYPFLDISGDPPFLRLVEVLLEATSIPGPIVTYGHFEKMVIGILAELVPGYSGHLMALRERIVDLLPLLRKHYYHPAMKGSWSIKAVLPTVVPELDYCHLGDVRDGGGAQAAYLECIDKGVDPIRRAKLEKDMLDYCGLDSLAMVELVRHFLGRNSV